MWTISKARTCIKKYISSFTQLQSRQKNRHSIKLFKDSSTTAYPSTWSPKHLCTILMRKNGNRLHSIISQFCTRKAGLTLGSSKVCPSILSQQCWSIFTSSRPSKNWAQWLLWQQWTGSSPNLLLLIIDAQTKIYHKWFHRPSLTVWMCFRSTTIEFLKEYLLFIVMPLRTSIWKLQASNFELRALP